MKKIILLSDGTGNSAASPQKTNVWRLYQALDLSEGSNQIAHYDSGVGTSSFRPTAILGLAFGWGLSANVKSIYGFLCRTYKPGDEIYGFGFSRGAFTMRTVIRFITSQGIVDPGLAKDDEDLNRLIDEAYSQFREDMYDPSFLSFFTRPIRKLYCRISNKLRGRANYNPERNIRYKDGPDDSHLIKFVGLWDTVAAYGFPIDEFARAWDKVVWPLIANNNDLSPRIGRACHALSLDERRESFHPVLWNESKELVESKRLQQVWFSGVHANVGGGYPDDSLSLISLGWMIEQSEVDDGLSFFELERRRYENIADVNGPIYDSREGLGRVYRYAPRNVARMYHNENPGLVNWFKRKFSAPSHNEHEAFATKPQVHHSVFQRLVESGDSYAPINIPDEYQVVCSESLEARRPMRAQYKEDGEVIVESESQAKLRREQQAYVWNKVRARQFIYFLTFAIAVYFLLFPFLADRVDGKSGADEALAEYFEPALGIFSYLIRSIPHLIGELMGIDLLKSWTSRYEAFPFVFSLGLVTIAGLLAVSSKLRRRVRAQMRICWQHVLEEDEDPANLDPGVITRLTTRFLQSDFYNRTLIPGIRLFVETATTILFLGLVFILISRVFFSSVDGTGIVCPSGPDNLPGPGVEGRSVVFEPTDICFATGMALTKHETYEIHLKISDDWSDNHVIKDEAVDANAHGLEDVPWYRYLLIPLRRQLLTDWYQVVARVDNVLFDVHPLEPGKEAKIDADNGELVATIIARRSGQLYLYVNDLIFFTPSLISRFYEENEGHVNVTVKHLPKAE